MMPPYVQLLPSVFLRADVYAAGQKMGLTMPAAYNPATDWDDEPTKPDIVLPRSIAQDGHPRPTPDLPPDIEQRLADVYEVPPPEMRRLKNWMEMRNLRVGHFSKAVDYLAQMRQEAAQDISDNEPTVRIDLRKKEKFHALVSQEAL